MKVSIGTLSIFGGIGQDALARNKLVEAGIVFGHGVSSLVGGGVDMATVAAMGCCAIGGLLLLGANGLSSSWNLIVGLGISWNLPWARLYTITGIGLGLVVVDLGFTTDVGVEVTVVTTAFGSGKDFSISLTLNHLFLVFCNVKCNSRTIQYNFRPYGWSLYVFLTSLHFNTETVKSCPSPCVSITLTSPLFVWLYF